ncbi:hypothetical protein EFN92_03700 [Lactococcus lactis]|uniref:ThuA domain-containing protein n=1 Tax=Lactococcus lactis TaxID=1358 RepID=UPI0021A6FA54|nr:ThuA domain-containing protein [Lactococcus lactis]MCT3091783.1 hypothetical protein [Lactococcus lactis]
MYKAFIISGGWQGHSPEAISQYFAAELEKENYEVTISRTLDVLDQITWLQAFDLIIMNWTRGNLSTERYENLQTAIASGTGLAGIHGGLLSAFQNSKKYMLLTGGVFVAHPDGVTTDYEVNIVEYDHPITRELTDFTVHTEQYYVLTDPAIHILATTDFDKAKHPNATNGLPIKLPVAWTKYWGKGKIFYQSLGHDLAVCQISQVTRLTIQGFKWATRKE